MIRVSNAKMMIIMVAQMKSYGKTRWLSKRSWGKSNTFLGLCLKLFRLLLFFNFTRVLSYSKVSTDDKAFQLLLKYHKKRCFDLVKVEVILPSKEKFGNFVQIIRSTAICDFEHHRSEKLPASKYMLKNNNKNNKNGVQYVHSQQ